MLKRQVRFVIYFVVLFVLTTFLLLSGRLHKSSFNVKVNLSVDRLSNEADKKPIQKNAAKHLPSRVIKKVKRFVFFIGFARSGHSIIASMLDAHPNVVIAHEYSLFSKWLENPILHSNKTWLFNTLYENSLYNSAEGLRMKNAKKKGYSLIIPGWWQGKYNRNIQVIGDKAGGMTAQVYGRNHSAFSATYQQLKHMLSGLPISVIHVLRNPFDNIATMLLYNHHQRRSVNQTHKFIDDDALKIQITSYFNQVRTVTDMIRRYHFNVLEVHNIDMISDPKKTMRKVTYPAESRSRELVQWSEENIRIVAQKIQRFESLQRYTF